MQFDKSMITDFLKEQGNNDQAQQADQEMPDKVDSEKDAGMLQKFGINPQDLMAKYGDKLPGGMGNKLGGMLGN